MTIKNRSGREFFPVKPFLTTDYAQGETTRTVPVFYYVPHFFPSWNDDKEHLIIKPRVTDSDYTCYRNAHGSNKVSTDEMGVASIRPIASHSTRIMTFRFENSASGLWPDDKGSYYKLIDKKAGATYKMKMYAIFASDDDFLENGFTMGTETETSRSGLFSDGVSRNISQLYRICYPSVNDFDVTDMAFTPPLISRIGGDTTPIYGQFYDWILHIYEV